MGIQCDHTLYHADRQGRLQGSWTEELVLDPHLGHRVRIVCWSCGKFYGYLRDGSSGARQALARAARDQAAATPLQNGGHQNGAQRSVSVAHEPKSTNPNARLRRSEIDCSQPRRLVSMGNVLEIFGYQETAVQGEQIRGPGSMRGPLRQDADRTAMVGLTKE